MPLRKDVLHCDSLFNEWMLSSWQVDFAPPVGYKEPEMKPRESQCDNADDEEDSIDYSAIKDMRAGFQVGVHVSH